MDGYPVRPCRPLVSGRGSSEYSTRAVNSALCFTGTTRLLVCATVLRLNNMPIYSPQLARPRQVLDCEDLPYRSLRTCSQEIGPRCF